MASPVTFGLRLLGGAVFLLDVALVLVEEVLLTFGCGYLSLELGCFLALLEVLLFLLALLCLLLLGQGAPLLVHVGDGGVDDLFQRLSLAHLLVDFGNQPNGALVSLFGVPLMHLHQLLESTLSESGILHEGFPLLEADFFLGPVTLSLAESHGQSGSLLNQELLSELVSCQLFVFLSRHLRLESCFIGLNWRNDGAELAVSLGHVAPSQQHGLVLDW